jgi:hypothetical protein
MWQNSCGKSKFGAYIPSVQTSRHTKITLDTTNSPTGNPEKKIKCGNKGCLSTALGSADPNLRQGKCHIYGIWTEIDTLFILDFL